MNERDPFIDDSIKAPAGQPIEYDGKLFSRILDPGLKVEEVSLEEYLEAVNAARSKRQLEVAEAA